MNTLIHCYWIGVGFFTGVDHDHGPGWRNSAITVGLALLWPILFPIHLGRRYARQWQRRGQR